MNFENNPENEETQKRNSRRRPRRRPKRRPEMNSSTTESNETNDENRRHISDPQAQIRRGSGPRLDPNTILMAEFNYARETAAQAMNDRHVMVNFYLIIVGVIFAAVANLLRLANDSGLGMGLTTVQWRQAATVLLVVLFLIGLLYLFKLIRLRQAWRDSALAMNQLKEYYSRRFRNYRMNKEAFLWNKDTLPPASKFWTLFFFSAVLIILLNVVAVSAALFLCGIPALTIYGVAFLLLIVQIGVYQIMLRKEW